MTLFRQLASFGMVGACATTVHVVVAWTLFTWTTVDPYAANCAAAVSAFFVSYFGNARLTFNQRVSIRSSLPKYVAISLVSFAITSAELAFTHSAGLPDAVFVLLVLVTVPPVTFALAKAWAFSARALSA